MPRSFDGDAALLRRFVSETLQNPHNAAILERLPLLGLPDAWLVAGCLFQTVWNLRSGFAPTAHVKDYDLFYFDASDLSEAAERSAQAHAAALFADLPITVEAKNQARVHLWYEQWFGYPYTPLRSARHGIERFLIPGTCVGLQPAAKAPHPRSTRPTGWTSCTRACCGPIRSARTFRCSRPRPTATASAGTGCRFRKSKSFWPPALAGQALAAMIFD